MPSSDVDLGELQRVQLTRTLHLWQRRAGHRSATDDILCAYYGQRAVPDATRCLDIGAGQGSVCMMLSGALPADAHFVAVEAQAISHQLLHRNIVDNGLIARFTTMRADLRTVDLSAHGPFDLITGSPPYMPIGSGPQPRDPQRAAARFELRGGVEAYASAIARWLGPEPRCRGLLLMDAAQDQRNRVAFDRAALHVVTKTTVIPRHGARPRYLLYAVCKSEPLSTADETLTVRDAKGRWTTEFETVREALQLPVPTRPER